MLRLVIVTCYGHCQISNDWFFVYFLILQGMKTKNNLMYKSSKSVTTFLPYQEVDDLNHLQDLFNVSLDLTRVTLLTCE